MAGAPVPVTLLGGYLGAGKTTAINALLASAGTMGHRLAVLVNDVGEVNIDAALVRSAGGDTIELTNGCVCCDISNGYFAAFDTLRARTDRLDHVVVELSGVADPARVAAWASTPGFRLDGVIVLLDADQARARLANRWSGDTVQRQLAAADVIVLTKLDLADAARTCDVRRLVASIAPGVPVIDAPALTHVLAGIEQVTRRPANTSDPHASHRDPHQVSTIVLPDVIDAEEFQRLLDELPPDIVRAKGFCTSPDGRVLLGQVVGRRRSVVAIAAAPGAVMNRLVTVALPPEMS